MFSACQYVELLAYQQFPFSHYSISGILTLASKIHPFFNERIAAWCGITHKQSYKVTPSLEDELSNLFDDASVSFKRDNVFIVSVIILIFHSCSYEMR